MNGVLNILKPPGMTSQNVVSFVKKTLNVDKAGHTGTLDPGAAGVLPICVGKATRISEYLMNDKKYYRAEMEMGLKSSTLDSYSPAESVDLPEINRHDIYDTFENFKGTIEQVPPMFSALKQNGVKLYDLARKGMVVEREPRKITIYELNIISMDGPRIVFDTVCSKGTYIRTLCSDIGHALGTDAIMTFLLRLGTGPFKISDSVTLYELSERARGNELEGMLHPVEFALEGFSKIYVDIQTSERVKHGAGFVLDNNVKMIRGSDNGIVLIFDYKGSFLAVGCKSENSRVINIDKVFA